MCIHNLIEFVFLDSILMYAFPSKQKASMVYSPCLLSGKQGFDSLLDLIG